MKELFYLIENERLPHMGCWFVRREGDFFINNSGGRTPVSGHTILESFFCREDDLDHRLTYLSDDTSKSGWLSPDAVFHGCPRKEHINYAILILHEDPSVLEELGWVHIYGNPSDTTESFGHMCALNIKQIQWLRSNGHYVSEYSESLIKNQ